MLADWGLAPSRGQGPQGMPQAQELGLSVQSFACGVVELGGTSLHRKGALGPWLDPELFLAVGSPSLGAGKVWLGLGSDWVATLGGGGSRDTTGHGGQGPRQEPRPAWQQPPTAPLPPA